MAKKWTEEEVNILRENYGKMSNRELGNILKRTTCAVQSRAVNMGISIKKETIPDKWSEEEIQILKCNYKEQDHKFLSKKLNRSISAIRHMGRKYNLTSLYNNYSLNEDYFSEINENTLYWAGFIAADGSISVTKKGYSLNIGLSIKDKVILDRFKKELKYDGPVKIKTSEKICYLYVYSKKIIEDLNNNFNIAPRKTFIYVPPPLPDNLKSSFAIGLIDGDGHIGISKEGYLHISLYGSFNTVLWFKKFVNQIVDAPNKIKQQKNSYAFVIKGKKALKLGEYLNSINVPFRLERKWNKIEECKKLNNIGEL